MTLQNGYWWRPSTQNGNMRSAKIQLAESNLNRFALCNSEEYRWPLGPIGQHQLYPRCEYGATPPAVGKSEQWNHSKSVCVRGANAKRRKWLSETNKHFI